MIYPSSRAHATNCKMCNTGRGQMKDSGRFNLQDLSGKSTELMKLTCYRCGYTVFFDMEAAKKFPYDGSADEEKFPQ